MNNVKVQTKLSIVMLATIVALVLCAVISSESMKQLQSKALETMEADERESYDEQIKQQVDNVVSLCQTIYDQYQAGVYTEEEAKKLAADEIRQLRYGDGGYFWVDQYDGTNVVLLGNDTEGTVWRRKMPMDIKWLKRSSVSDRRQMEDIQIMYSRKKARLNLLRNVPTVKHLNRLNG